MKLRAYVDGNLLKMVSVKKSFFKLLFVPCLARYLQHRDIHFSFISATLMDYCDRNENKIRTCLRKKNPS